MDISKLTVARGKIDISLPWRVSQRWKVWLEYPRRWNSFSCYLWYTPGAYEMRDMVSTCGVWQVYLIPFLPYFTGWKMISSKIDMWMPLCRLMKCQLPHSILLSFEWDNFLRIDPLYLARPLIVGHFIIYCLAERWRFPTDANRQIRSKFIKWPASAYVSFFQSTSMTHSTIQPFFESSA